MSHFILIPGANHGGWWYQPLVERLVEHGHSATAVTLSGLDPDGPAAPAANLDTHVGEVVDLLRSQQQPVILVGHSYGGSVITGATDAVPDAVRTLVYLDAFVPEDGDTCYSMTNDEQRAWYVNDCGETGLGLAPLPFFDERTRPHPIGTLLQRSKITGAWRQVPTKIYIAAADPAWVKESPFVPTTLRLRDDPSFVVIDAPATHNLLKDGPDLLLTLLSDAATRG